jgi:hypothetical protein
MKFFLSFIFTFIVITVLKSQITTDFNIKLNPDPVYFSSFTNIHQIDSFYISIGSSNSSIGGNKIYKHNKYGQIVKRKSYPIFIGTDYYWGKNYFVSAGTIIDTPYYHSHGFMSCIDYNLDTLWTKEFTTLNQNYQMTTNHPVKLRKTPDGGFLILGSTILDTVPGLISYPYFMKTDQYGNIDWFKIYYSFPDVQFFSFELTGNLGIIVNTNKNNGSIIKMSALGNIENVFNYNNYPYVGVDYFTDMSLYNSDEVLLVKVVKLNASFKEGISFVRFNYVSWQKKTDTIYDFIKSINPCSFRVFALPNLEILISGSGSLIADSTGWNPYYCCQYKGLFYTIDSIGDSISLITLSHDTSIEAQHSIYDVELTADGGLVGCGSIIGKDTSGGWYFKIASGIFATGLSEPTIKYQEFNYQLFPNPAINQIIIKFETPIKSRLEIIVYDVFGRELVHKTLSAETVTSTISLNGVQSGVYFYRIIKDRSVISSGKFIKN